MGHIISAEGLKPHQEKVRAMKDMPPPETKEDVHRFLDSIQYLATSFRCWQKLRHHCGSSPERIFHWDESRPDAFQKLKNMCSKVAVLAYYDVRKEWTIQCNASKSVVGVVFLQEGRPIAYASRKRRDSEINWSPIEKKI